MFRHVLLVLIAMAVPACGDKGTSAPPAPTPVVTTASVAISPTTDMLKIQESVTLAATATMSDGTTRSVAGTWTSDSAAVVTADVAGKVTGMGSGQATVTVTYDGVKATRSIRVVPDYQGNWAGDYTVLSCQDSGDFTREEWCQAAIKSGTIQVTMALSQTRDAVTGSWTHSAMTGATQGTIEADGTLVLTGTGAFDGTPMTITGWRTRSTDNKNQTGTFTLTFASSVWTGSAQARVEIRTCVKAT